jgi:hypothetical protein
MINQILKQLKIKIETQVNLKRTEVTTDRSLAIDPPPNPKPPKVYCTV